MSQPQHKHYSVLPILLLGLLFATIGLSCGGGGGGGTPPPPPADIQAQGIFTSNGDGSANFSGATPSTPDNRTLTNIRGMVHGDLPNQKFIFFDMGTNVLYEGTITSVTNGSVTGTASVYKDGVIVDSGIAVTGTATSRSTVDLSFAQSNNGNFLSGSVKGLYSSVYEKAATFAKIDSNYSGIIIPDIWTSTVAGSVKSAIPGMYAGNFDVSENTLPNNKKVGGYTEQLQVGGITNQCNITGDLNHDASRNIYITNTILTQIKSCTISNSPDYNGMSTVFKEDAQGKGTEMWYAVSNGANSIFMVLTRP